MTKQPFALVTILITMGCGAGAAESATAAATPIGPTPSAQVTIQVNAPGHIMAGGLGASWHSIRVAGVPGKYAKNIGGKAPQGSALLGNPPLAATMAWQDLERHASWLGLDWLRVELERRMYEPERGRYDWKNEEMETLHRILDWCQRNDADVFLTEMWRAVDWLAQPGIHPVRSAPNDPVGYSEGLATLVEHLQRDRKYSCVKWLCLNNEPNSAQWWTSDDKAITLQAMAAAVRSEFDRRGISLPLSGPDYSGVPKEGPNCPELLPFIGAVDLHTYSGAHYIAGLKEWVQWAHENKRPFFMSEFGDMPLGWGGDKPAPASFEASLSHGIRVLTGMNLGIDAFNRWSYVNRGDIDGQWQMVRTWDLKNKVYYDRVEPEPAAYYGYAMLTRFTAKHSRILDLTFTVSEGPKSHPPFEVAALRSPKGQTTCIIVNREPKNRAIDVHWEGLTSAILLHRYQLTEPMLADPAFKLRSDAQTDLSPEQPRLQVTVPGRSITVYTSYDLGPDDPGVMAEVPAAP